MGDLTYLSTLELTKFLLAIVLLLSLAHWFGYICHRFKMPRVIGEITGGLILGPTVMGIFAPKFYNFIFNGSGLEGKLISVVYWMGLILLMFIAGLEIQKSFSKKDKITISIIILGATIIPFIVGLMAPSFFDFSPYLGFAQNLLALKIVIAIAIAVTSIPVISKIFIDLGIINTPFAKIVIAIATIEDIILWGALSVTTGLVSSSNSSLRAIAYSIFLNFIFFGAGLLLLPRLFKFLNNLKYNLLIKSSSTGYALIMCFLFAALASLFNINIIFGAFLAGVIFGMTPNEKFETAKNNIKDIALSFFIPLYFAIVGLKLDLIHHFEIAFFLGFLLFASFFKIIGTLIAARFTQKDWLSCFNLAIATNTKGGPGIVLATIAFETGIINEIFFVTLVMIAIFTSLLAGCWFKYVLSKGWWLLKEETENAS